MDTSPDEADDLAQRTAALRRLARGVLYDRASADDVVQEAWLAALGKSPRSAGLSGFVLRIARNANRADARRRRRELSAAADERLPSAVDSAARVETMRRLVDAVGALEEPLREAILLRYFDDLPPRVIAKRLDVPVETVRTRIKRGLERMRRRLDARGGDRDAFLAALLPLAGRAPSPAILAPWTGALLVSKAFLPAAVAIAVMLFSIVYLVAIRDRDDGLAPAERSVALDPRAPDAETEDESVALGQEPAADRRGALPIVESEAGGSWVVRGRIALGIGAGLPNGRVRAELHAGRVEDGDPSAPIDTALLTADELGEFTWPLPPPERTVTVVVKGEMPEHFASADRAIATVGSSAPQMLQARVYPIDSRLTGRVVGPDGAGVAGARITTRQAEGRSDREGRFDLPASSAEPRIAGEVLAAGYAQRSFTVQPLRPGTLSTGDLVLRGGARVIGRVVAEDGTAIEGATVSTDWRGFGTPGASPVARTDAEGRFELGELDPEDSHLALCVEHAAHARASLALTGLSAEGEPAQVEVVLHRGAAVRGRVVHEDGSPAPGTEIVVGFHPDGIPRLGGETDLDGRFEIARVPPGEQTVWALRSGLQAARLAIDVPARGEVEGLELVLASGREVTGRVLDESGKPLPWVMVYVDSFPDSTIYVPRTYSDRDGGFRLTGLPRSECVVGFLSSGYARHEQRIGARGEEILVRMQRTGRLAGRVLDGRTGRPVESFTIRFVPAELPPGGRGIDGYWARWSSTGQTFTATDGYWNADGEELEPGRWVGVEATAPGYGLGLIPALSSEVDPDPDAHPILLYGPARVVGRVVEAASGAPIAGARVHRAAGPDPAPWGGRSAETDAEGRFELEVPYGTTTLAVAQASGRIFVDEPFELPPGAVVERIVSVETGLALQGVLLAPDGSPLAGETIELDAAETVTRESRNEVASTDAQGAFTFEDLSPGLYRVSWIETRGDVRCGRIVRLVEVGEQGSPEPLRLQMQGSGTLVGTVSYAGGLPEAVGVAIRPRHDPARRTSKDGRNVWAGSAFGVVAERGAFRVEGLEPGTYHVAAWIPSGSGGRNSIGSVVVEVLEGGIVEASIEIIDPVR